MLFTVGEVVRVLGARLLPGSAGRGVEEREISAVASDSRAVSPGSLFVALPGARTDGHLYLDQAFARGAAAALVAREPPVPLPGPCLLVPDTRLGVGQLARYHRLKFSPTVVGITGSVGKTSTKDLTAAVLSVRYRVLKNEGNLNTEVGVPLTLFRLEASHQVAVIEMAMRGRGQIAYLADLARPHLGVITNVGESHLELLGSLEELARAKGELLASLPADGVAVLNGDDARARTLGRDFPGRVILFGLGEDCQVRGSRLRSRPEGGTSFRLNLGGEEIPVTLPVPGRHQVANALAAAAVAWALGLLPEEIRHGLESSALSGMRMEVARWGGVVVVNDAYNASPASTSAALEALAEMPGRRRLAVLGDMRELGERTVPGHREVGALAARLGVDLLVAVGEWSCHLARGAREEGLLPGKIFCCRSAEEAAPLVAGLTREGDVVLVKGSRAVGLEKVVAALRERLERS